jgi:hypothetical protein
MANNVRELAGEIVHRYRSGAIKTKAQADKAFEEMAQKLMTNGLDRFAAITATRNAVHAAIKEQEATNEQT